MSRPRTPSRSGAPVAVAVLMLLGLALATMLVLDKQDRLRLAADGRVRAAVADAVASTADGIRSQLAQAAVPTAGDQTIAVDGEGSSRPSADRLTEARDSGSPVLDDRGASATIVVPVFRSGLPVLTTAERRLGLTGYRVVPLSVGPQLSDAAPDGGGMVVVSPQGTVVAGTGTAPPRTRAYAADLALQDQPGWRLEAWVPNPGTPTSTWLEAAGILAAAALTGAFLAVLSRQRRIESRRSHDLERQRLLITELAPVVQSSLDLAHVVPALSTHLIDSLGLRGLGLYVPKGSGEQEIFTWGQSPDATVHAPSHVPAWLETDQTYAVPLTRGGRLLGLLRVVAGVPLSQHDLIALATASELVGSTLANAEAFARQQVLVEQMQAVDELKTVFLATASHELRTPVTAIVGFSEILLAQRDTLTPEMSRQFLDRVLSNAKGLEALIEQLLDFSRLERGMHPVGEELLDLGARVEAVLSEQPGVFEGHELALSMRPGCWVQGSPAAVERIVTNLVGNAAKYSPPGTTVTVSVRTERDRCLLVVDDEGPGVPVADRSRVFSRFFRGSGDAVASTGGAGIGLAIVAEYAASMSATTSVLSTPAGGARFLVSFPRSAGLDARGAQHVASS